MTLAYWKKKSKRSKKSKLIGYIRLNSVRQIPELLELDKPDECISITLQEPPTKFYQELWNKEESTNFKFAGWNYTL